MNLLRISLTLLIFSVFDLIKTLLIPIGTLLQESSTGAQFRLLEEVRWDQNDPNSLKKKKKIEALDEGKGGEHTDSHANWSFVDTDFSAVQIQDPSAIVLEEYGIIDVIIDSVNYDGSSYKKEIDRWRAAGIYPRLWPIQHVPLEGIFRIEINPSLKLSQDEREAYEAAVQVAILDYLDGLKMGKPLVFPQLIKEVLSLENIENFDEFLVTTWLDAIPWDFFFSDKRILIAEDSRFEPGIIGVASEEKPLFIDIEAKVTGQNADAIRADIEALFQQFAPTAATSSREISVGAISQIISDTSHDVSQSRSILNPLSKKKTQLPFPHQRQKAIFNLTLTASSWCNRDAKVNDANGELKHLDVSFVEMPTLRKLFIYEKELEVLGAIPLKLPGFLTEDQITEITTQAATEVRQFLQQLEPEQDLEYSQLQQVLEKMPNVLEVAIDPSDFRVFDEAGNPLKDRTESRDKITVKAREKIKAVPPLISAGVETLEIHLEQLAITFLSPNKKIIAYGKNSDQLFKT